MTALLTLALTFALGQAPSVLSETCEVRGRITDKETGRPLARAIVHLSLRDGQQSFWARSDEDGTYAFTRLVPGTYGGFVEAGQFRATHVTQPLGSPRGFTLTAGQVRSDVNVALPRALAMTVRVVNEHAEPLAGVRISVIDAESGRTVRTGWTRSTDDRGHVREFGLHSGRYKVCAELNHRGSTRASRHEGFVRTCYPSATEAQAEPVPLEGIDIEDLEIRMRRGRTFVISGTLLDSVGNPVPKATISLGTFWRNGSSSRGIQLEADGGFTSVDVEPGEYAIQVSLGGPERPEDRRDLEIAFVPLRIDSADVTGLVVSTTKAVDVAGRVTIDDPAVTLPRPHGYAPLHILARLADQYLPGSAGSRSAMLGDDHVFYLAGLFGRRTLQVSNIPPGWFVKAIKYDGKDITDVPTEFTGSRDPSALEIVMSTRGAIVSGRAVDERGEPVRGARVLIFPANRRRWGAFTVPYAIASATGAFKLGPQRPGDYLVVAVGPNERIPDFEAEERMTRLAEAAERVTLNDAEERTIDLRIEKIR